MDTEEKKIEIKLATSPKEIESMLKEEDKRSTVKKIDDYLAQFFDVTLADKVIFYRLFATMINAWVPLIESLVVLKEQTKSPKFKVILDSVIRRVSSGSTIANSMHLYPEVFEDAEIWVIKAWEESGKLKDILLKLADQIERSSLITWKIKWAMIYPVVILLVVLLSLYAIMVLVIPKIKEMFSSMWAELPEITQMLINASDFLLEEWFLWINNWVSIILLCILSFIIFTYWKKTKTWDYYTSLALLYVPLFWMLEQKISVAKFCSAISLLTGSGIDLIESLRLTSNMIWNDAYKIRILRIVQDVQQWLSVAQNMKRDTLYFPSMVTSMILVWEKTGRISEVTSKVAEYFESEVDALIKNLMQLIEPLIIVVVWLLVAWIVVAVMVPLLSMSDIVAM